jgi:hypothetical protein
MRMTSVQSERGLSAPQGSMAAVGSNGRTMNVAARSLTPAEMSWGPSLATRPCIGSL